MIDRDERGAGIDDDEIARRGVVSGGGGVVVSGGGTSDGGGAGTIEGSSSFCDMAVRGYSNGSANDGSGRVDLGRSNRAAISATNEAAEPGPARAYILLPASCPAFSRS